MKYAATAARMRQYEASLFARGHSPLIMMEDAAQSVARRICSEVPPCPALIACGSGNNGGDGYAVARLLATAGYGVTIFACPGEKTPDCAANVRAAAAFDIPVETEIAALPLGCGVIVDALFGTGLNRALTGIYVDVIDAVNAMRGAVYAVDLPSGVNADTGAVMGAAVRADVTVALESYKPGHLLLPGRELCGRLVLAKLTPGGPATDIALLEKGDLPAAFAPRRMDSHKGDYGKALLIGGAAGFSGAVTMSAKAALRTGTGLLSLGVPGEIAPALWAALPEAMTHPLAHRTSSPEIATHPDKDIAALLRDKTCLAAGPGWVNGDADILDALLRSRLPSVLDASALTLLADEPRLTALLHGNCVLTPHVGEMSRLTGLSIREIAVDPMGIAASFSQKHGCPLLLKGATTVIADGDKLTLNTSGTTALAKGGSGDVLTGIILALLAQGNSAYDAARYGALLLGMAAERLEMPPQCALASDIIDALPAAIASACNG